MASEVANKKKRRVWTRPEEDELIVHLRWLVANGWKADNAFRMGYLEKLEEFMKVRFPHAGITGSKHINSKLTVWKKLYQDLRTITSQSGAGFNRTYHTIDVDDEQWKTVVKANPKLDYMRFKSWPFFDDWIYIFGKDGATGEGATGYEEAAAGYEDTPAEYEEIDNENDYATYSDFDAPVVGLKPNIAGNATSKLPPINFTGTKIPPVNTTKTTKLPLNTEKSEPESTRKAKGTIKSQVKGTKRTASEAGLQSEKVMHVMEGYLQHYKEFSEKMVAKFDSPPAVVNNIPAPPDLAAEKTGKIIDLMEQMTDLQPADRVYLGFKIANSPTHADYFLQSSPASRAMFIQHMRANNL